MRAELLDDGSPPGTAVRTQSQELEQLTGNGPREYFPLPPLPPLRNCTGTATALVSNEVDKVGQRNFIIQNLASGAFWAPPYYNLTPSSGTWTSVHALPPGGRISGIGSHVICTEHGVRKRFLAVYFDENVFHIFDGIREIKASSASATWRKARWPRSLLGLAELGISINGKKETITYFRPSLRHWFEGGTLNDTDMAHAVNTYVNDSEAKERLLNAL